MEAIYRVCGLLPGPKFEVGPAAEKNSLPEKTYCRGPGISWKAQKDNLTFTSTFWLKKDRISHNQKVQNKNFSVTSKYQLSINFLLQKKTVSPIPRKFLNKNFPVVSKYHISVKFLAQKDRILYPLKIQNKGSLAINKQYSTVKKIPCRRF